MANTPATPGTLRTATITIPEGMDPAKVAKAFEKFTELTGKYKLIGKADGQALGRLKKAHAPEYLKYRQEEWKKVGLDPSGLTINT